MKLMDAEKTAVAIINKARKDKIDLVKTAPDEAAKEIAVLRDQRQKEHNTFLKGPGALQEEFRSKLMVETEEQITKLRSKAAQAKGDVISLYLKAVTEVSFDYIQSS